MKDAKKAEAIRKVIQARLAKTQKERPFGYLVREAPKEDVQALRQLAGHMQEGQFITKFRKIFCRDEMNEDLVLEPARRGEQEDTSEYQEILPTSPPLEDLPLGQPKLHMSRAVKLVLCGIDVCRSGPGWYRYIARRFVM